MQVQTSESNDPTLIGGALVDGAFIDSDLGIVPRTRRTYVSKGILPPPDTNFRGRDLWLVSKYREFKARLLSGEFAADRSSRLPSQRTNP